MKASPIYNHVAIVGRSSRDFGAYDGYTQRILVGTSRVNSHELGTISVQRIVQADGTVEFALYLDNTMLRRGILDGKVFVREDITDL